MLAIAMTVIVKNAKAVVAAAEAAVSVRLCSSRGEQRAIIFFYSDT